MSTHPLCLGCATFYACASGATGVVNGFWNKSSEKEKIEKAEIELKKGISDFVKNILNNNLEQAQDKDIWQTLCTSPKLPCLAKNDKDKIINNIPVVKEVLEALINNDNMDNLLPEHYATIKSKIERLGNRPVAKV